MKKIIVSGAAGRLGSSILRRCLAEEGQEVVGALVRPGSKHESKLVDGADGLKYSSDFVAVVQSVGAAQVVLIEASLVPAALNHLQIASKLGVAVCLATTGFSSSQTQELKTYAEQIPLLWAPNLSLGVNVMHALVAQAARALPNYHVELVEMHHAQKTRCAKWHSVGPSQNGLLKPKGATLSEMRLWLGQVMLVLGDKLRLVSKHFEAVMSMESIPSTLLGETERVEIIHRAASRDAFAWGAVRTVGFLERTDKPAGWYTMADVLGLGLQQLMMPL